MNVQCVRYRAAALLYYEIFVLRTFPFWRHLVCLRCINVSLGAEETNGGKAHCKELIPNISKQIFLEKELRGGLGPNFHIHVSVSDLYTYSHDGSAYSAAGNMWNV